MVSCITLIVESFISAFLSHTACRTPSLPNHSHPRRPRQVLYCEWIAGDEMANEDAAIQAESATTTSSSATRGGDDDLMDDEEAPSKSHAHDDGGAIQCDGRFSYFSRVVYVSI